LITACALLLCLAGGTSIYLASSQQQWRAKPLPRVARWIGWLLAALGMAAWIVVDGIGVGITAALSTLMLAWVALPYLSWWRRALRKASA
jgi:hypothetical protein